MGFTDKPQLALAFFLACALAGGGLVLRALSRLAEPAEPSVVGSLACDVEAGADGGYEADAGVPGVACRLTPQSDEATARVEVDSVVFVVKRDEPEGDVLESWVNHALATCAVHGPIEARVDGQQRLGCTRCEAYYTVTAADRAGP